ncbi:MAG: hypothetical protein R3E32_27195 [Chitinophagales bacterium]
MTIQEAVANFKYLIENAITEGGNKAKTAIIRSSKPILNIHEAVKHELVRNGVDENKIFPPLGERVPELKIAGSLKKKDQDICIIPNIKRKKEILPDGLLEGTVDPFGIHFTSRTISINVRSQVSSIQKNFDTMYERTISEAQNLHDRCPNMVLGEVYMIAVPEYDDRQFVNKKVNFRNINPRLVEKYIKSFQAINHRKNIQKNFYQYESACLLIVDFRPDRPKIYTTIEELKKDGLLNENSSITMEGLEWENFVPNLLRIYKHRFGGNGFFNFFLM